MLRNKFEHIHQCHRIPSHCTSPRMFRLSGHRVRPTFGAAYIARMTIKTIFRIVRMTGTSDKLVDYICIVLRKIITECIFAMSRVPSFAKSSLSPLSSTRTLSSFPSPSKSTLISEFFVICFYSTAKVQHFFDRAKDWVLIFGKYT